MISLQIVWKLKFVYIFQILELLQDEDVDIRVAAVTGTCAILRQCRTHPQILGLGKSEKNKAVLLSNTYLLG